jgi:hypothetical protein
MIDLIITMIDDRLDNYNDRGHVGVLHCNYVSALLIIGRRPCRDRVYL